MYPHLLLTLHIYYAPRYTHVVSLSQCLCFSLSFLKNGPTPASFSFIFGLFQTNYTILTANKWEKMSIEYRCQDLNPRPLEQESIPTTTRTGIPPSLSLTLSNKHSLSQPSLLTHPIHFICLHSSLQRFSTQQPTDFGIQEEEELRAKMTPGKNVSI